jgi:putative membrane protein
MLRRANAGEENAMKKCIGRAIFSVILAASVCGPSAAQEAASPDAAFVEQAASGGMMEVELGKLAQQKAQSAAVKAFGQHMVTDHGKANERLAALATSKGIAVPRTMNEKHQAAVDGLAKLSGAEFDRKYIDTMVKDHEKDVTDFEHQLKQGQDADLKKFAEETLPTLREHLGQALSIDKDQDAAAAAQTGDAEGGSDQ